MGTVTAHASPSRLCGPAGFPPFSRGWELPRRDRVPSSLSAALPRERLGGAGGSVRGARGCGASGGEGFGRKRCSLCLRESVRRALSLPLVGPLRGRRCAGTRWGEWRRDHCRAEAESHERCWGGRVRNRVRTLWCPSAFDTPMAFPRNLLW